MKHAFAAIVGAGIVLFVGWCGGQNFDTRDADLAVIVICALAAGGWCFGLSRVWEGK